MKKWAILFLAVTLLFGTVSLVVADKPTGFDTQGNETAWANNNDCTKIQSGLITDTLGNPVGVGYDEFGYNYQAHLFNGRYCDYDRVIGGDYCDVDLMMKWNDAWLSNVSCDEDYKLDRHYDYLSYIGSGAWLTNHQRGVNEDGSHWEYFVKIVAAPADATVAGGFWYTADGTEIGPVIWGEFAIIQQVSNDPTLDEHGLLYKSPASPGFGYYTP